MDLRSQQTLTTPELVSAASQVSSPATLRAVVSPCRRSCLKLTACPSPRLGRCFAVVYFTLSK